MTTNASKIQVWRDANPGKQVTTAVVREILGVPNLCGAKLQGADLQGADLWDANLWGAKLQGANLQGADLQGANLWGADLWDANLWGANLQGANLQGADLQGANLRGANLQGANLWDVRQVTMQLRGMPSGEMILFPAPEGWRLHVGCWEGTTDELRELIAGDDWPEARGVEIKRRRPYLEAALLLVDLHITNNPDVVTSLAERWAVKP